MANKVHERVEKKILSINESSAAIIPAEWRKRLGIDKDEEIVMDLSYSEKHDQYFVAVYSKHKKEYPKGFE